MTLPRIIALAKLLHVGIWSVTPIPRRQSRYRCRSIQAAAPAIALALAAALPAGAQGAAAVTMAEVFVRGAADNATPAPPPSCQPPACEFRLYRLDGMQDIEARINRELAAAGATSEEAAQAWAVANEERIKKEYSEQIMAAAGGVTLAMSYRLKRVPAVVLNRSVAVYDTTDVGHAIDYARKQGLLK